MSTRIVEIRQNVLNKNDLLAHQLRDRFTAAGAFTVNLVSSPGSGKTAFLQRTLTELLAQGTRVAALVGDLETDNDARRLAASGAPVRQINTHGRCHLEAEMIESHLAGWDPADFDFLFIENVGNLVCPSSYDLGESLRVVMLSVTEGEDKPLKYPGIFHSADLAVITKHDLAAACELDRAALLTNLEAVCPGRPVLFTSARTGEGFPEWLALLAERRAGRDPGTIAS